MSEALDGPALGAIVLEQTDLRKTLERIAAP